MKFRSFPMRKIQLVVRVNAPASAVWKHLVAWRTQGEWMLGTQVWEVDGGENVGARIAAFSGIFPRARKLGFIDYMTITKWEPPTICEVIHTGRIVRGTGAFEVVALSAETSEFHWSEDVIVPLWALGQLLWPVVSQILRVGVWISLRRFASYVEDFDE
jgi:hypothetical protein